ncbi:unnamed protein product [Owenia fusiformis]|uniref:Ig-like domain-containing protein n=1 Tax=Owenia fusiformis TaxID=6347 RepID=A0A8S4N1F0_OWEFU|nr:unnamed protein product [Owenia fusiformis]
MKQMEIKMNWIFALILTLGVTTINGRTVNRKFPATVGSSVTIPCNKPVSDGRLIWGKSPGPTIAIDGVLQSGIDKSKFTLTETNGYQTLGISGLSLEDNGIYDCHLLADSDTDGTEVIILVPPEPLVNNPPMRIVYENSDIEMECISPNGKPLADISWTLTNRRGEVQPLTGVDTDVIQANGLGTRTSKLKYKMTREAIGATFKCKAERSELFYSEEKTFNTTLYVRPLNPTIIGNEEGTSVNTMVEITCFAFDANPAATIDWYKDNVKLSGETTLANATEHGTFDAYNTLSFVVDLYDNNTVYECRVNHPVMQMNSEAEKTASRTILVNYPPNIIANNATVSMMELNQVTVPCVVNGQPPAHVEWYLDGKQINTSSPRYYNSLQGKDPIVADLTILSTHGRDKGTYECRGFNKLGSATAFSSTLDIYHRPYCLRQKRKYATELNKAVDIFCHVESNPAMVIITWLYDGTYLDVNATVDILDDQHTYAKLTYTPRTEANYGTFQCNATNPIDNMDEPCFIEILPPGPADPPAYCHTSYASGYELILECMETFDGGSTPTYELQFKAEGKYKTIQSDNVPQFNMTGLTPETNYTFRICAHNSGFRAYVNCTGDITAYTLNTNGTFMPTSQPVKAQSFTETEAFIALCIILGLLLIIVIIIIIMCVVCCKRKKYTSGDLTIANPHQDVEKNVGGYDNEAMEMQQSQQSLNLDLQPDAEPAKLGAEVNIDEALAIYQLHAFKGASSKDEPEDPGYGSVSKKSDSDKAEVALNVLDLESIQQTEQELQEHLARASLALAVDQEQKQQVAAKQELKEKVEQEVKEELLHAAIAHAAEQDLKEQAERAAEEELKEKMEQEAKEALVRAAIAHAAEQELKEQAERAAEEELREKMEQEAKEALVRAAIAHAAEQELKEQAERAAEEELREKMEQEAKEALVRAAIAHAAEQELKEQAERAAEEELREKMEQEAKEALVRAAIAHAAEQELKEQAERAAEEELREKMEQEAKEALVRAAIAHAAEQELIEQEQKEQLAREAAVQALEDANMELLRKMEENRRIAEMIVPGAEGDPKEETVLDKMLKEYETDIKETGNKESANGEDSRKYSVSDIDDVLKEFEIKDIDIEGKPAGKK